MAKRLLELIRRGWRKPPRVIAQWLARQAAAEWYQLKAPARARALVPEKLLGLLGASSLEALWTRLAEAPPPAFAGPVSLEKYEALCPGDGARILAAADDACRRRVDLLGSGPVELGTPIPWHKDFKSGHSWPVVPCRRLDLLDLGRDSDVKVPWELSRLQWLIPAGQAYLLCGDEGHAKAVREIIEEWAAANPLARGVNWACTMDVALRAITLVWLFHVFHHSAAWHDGRFRADFLKLLYLHGDFISHHLEWSDVNGNHLITDAAGLVVVGLFFGAGDGAGDGPHSWQRRGWEILTDELPKQVFLDGVDFEVSAAYQRLVMEIFLLPALYRRNAGLDIDQDYAVRLCKMAGFVAAYSRADGSTPLWGDADDGRVLPFGGLGTNINDHRYLVALTALSLDDGDLLALASAAGTKTAAEVFWLLGPEAVKKIPATPQIPGSEAFRDGGVYIMRGGEDPGEDHVFIDCGAVGFDGRGGHGHNDCLSLEAMLAGVLLFTDCGAYVYSADPEWRNAFRSTAFHNTPMIDAQEINRFVRPEYLWALHDDAEPEVREWTTAGDAPGDTDVFVGAHSGYRRLAEPVTPVRSVRLDKTRHSLVVIDRFEGTGAHAVRIPYHLAPGVDAIEQERGQWRLKAGGREFLLVFDNGEAGGGDENGGWTVSLGEGWVSPSYGVKHPAKVLNFIHQGALAPLAVAVMPADTAPENPLQWLKGEAARL
jgi:hypothetical protein